METKVKFEIGVKKMLTNINDWDLAPLWSPKTIKKATKDWFKYLEKMKQKIYNIKNLSKIIDLEKKSKTVVLCHGVYDLLHIGHIKHLNKAKEYADILIVTITSDKFVNKGPGKPIFNQQLRSEAIAELKSVDYVAINETPTAVNAINFLKPNFYCKVKIIKILKMILLEKLEMKFEL